MIPRIEKLCLPRYRRDPIWKFWQPNARVEKIHPPIFWKCLDSKSETIRKQISSQARSCSDACHYTTLVDKDYYVYVDYEHEDIQHTTWKESIDDKSQRKIPKKKSSVVEQGIQRCFQLKSFKRRSRSEVLTKKFYHRKYFLPRCLREHTLTNLVAIAKDAKLEIEILGHVILHPNELSKDEIEMFELTSDFGDIYEGHIIRINREKLVLLLSSTNHSYIKLSSTEHLDKSVEFKENLSNSEELILNHVREYFQTKTNPSVEDIRRIEIEFEPLNNSEKRRMMIYLLSDEDIIDQLSFEIDQDEILQSDLHFLQSIKEKSMIEFLKDKLRASVQEHDSNLAWDDQIIETMQTMFDAYAKKRLSNYAREECMRLGMEYSFDDMLDSLDCEEVPIDIKTMIDEIQKRLILQMQRRLEAKTTATVLLIGPSKKRKIESADKEVIVLDHHREIFITKSDTQLRPTKVKDIQRHYGSIVYHDENDGGPKRFDRLSMAIDSLTVLTRQQQRKHLVLEQDEKFFIELGSGIRQLQTFEDQTKDRLLVYECEQDKNIEKETLSNEEDQSNSLKTTSIDTKSFNTSAYIRQKDLKKLNDIKQRQNRRKLVRSLAEYEKHRLKRKKKRQVQTRTKTLNNKINLKQLFLFRLIGKRKTIIKTKHQTLKDININAITRKSMDTNSNTDIRTTDHQSPNEKLHSNENDETDRSSSDTENYLYLLYRSLSSLTKQVNEIYQSKSAQLIASLDLAHIFITFLHIRKDIAHEIASKILAARQRLIPLVSTTKSSSKSRTNDEDQNDHTSMSSGISTAEDDDTIISETSDLSETLVNDDEDLFPEIIQRKQYTLYANQTIHSSNSQYAMGHITSYLSTVDWRVFNYITKHFVQNSGIVTRHALEFSSALIMDLIEDSVYQTYFHLKWCSNSSIHLENKKTDEYIEDVMVGDFLRKSIDQLRNHLKLINLPLLESFTLIQTLKKYTGEDFVQVIQSMYHYPVPTDRDPCIWFSVDILIKTISSLKNDILNNTKAHYLSDYTKFEYLLVSYFHKIEIIHNLRDILDEHATKGNSSCPTSDRKSLLHLIDLNQAPKFVSDQAFKRFHVNKHCHLNGDVKAFKELFLFSTGKRNIEPVRRPYIPLNMNDLVAQQQYHVIKPSPSIIAKYHGRWEGQRTDMNKRHLRKNSYQFDELIDSTNKDNLPTEMRDLLENMMKNYGSMEENSTLVSGEDQQEVLSEEDLARLIENAIDAVERFDRDHNIDDRKLQNKKTVNDRLAEFFKYAGRYGVRVLDDVLKLAKQRSSDPNEYLPLAVDLLKDRLKRSGTSEMATKDDQFVRTLESLLAATNDEPELIETLLKKRSKEHSQQPAISKSVTQKKSIEEVRKSAATLSNKEELIESTIPSIKLKEKNKEFPDVSSETKIPQTGLTVAQLIVLISENNRTPLKLTETQIERMCQKQNLSKVQLQEYVKKLERSNEIQNKFKLTEEQLVQIALEENIPMVEVEHLETLSDHSRLTDTQIRSLVTQLNINNCSSTRSELPLVLHLDQFIELCHRQQIKIDSFIENQTNASNLALSVYSKSKFSLTSSQIVYLINQNKFDVKRLKMIEQYLKTQEKQKQRFHLKPLQLAYFFHNRRPIYEQKLEGLTATQLIALYMLQPSSRGTQTAHFSLTYEQIKQMALQQNMSLEHFRSLTSSQKPFELSHSQWMYIAAENQIPVKEIQSIHQDQKSTVLDREQLCSLVYQHNQSYPTPNSSSHPQQRICLSVEQIFSLAKYSAVTLDQLIACVTKDIDVTQPYQFHLKPEQLASLWAPKYFESTLSPATPPSPQFILNDEQFRSLLHLVSTSKNALQSKSISSIQSIKSNDPISLTPVSTDMQIQLPCSLADQLAAMHRRLKSSIQSHVDTTEFVSDSILKRNRIDSTLHLVHQLSLHTIDDIANKEIEMIPSFVIDLLKVNPMTKDTYTSIQKGDIAVHTLDESVDPAIKDHLTKDIIESIQAHQLTYPQVQQIQTTFLIPKLFSEFKSGRLPPHILDAYKSLSPLQIINKVRSSITQLQTSLLQKPSIISELDSMLPSVIQQTTTSNTKISETDRQIPSLERDKTVAETTQSQPIVIYPESFSIRQQMLEELRSCFNTQLIELKKEYNIEPIKGKASIQQITNKLRTMEMTKNLESLIGREIDEVDILNILEGHVNHLLVQSEIETEQTNELFERNHQHRLNRINERIELIHVLQTHIENERLKRPLNSDEFTALVLEDVPKFEQLTNLQLTEDDLRILSMDRFASLQQSITRQLTESEYRQLLQTDAPIDYIEKNIFKRSLTTEERIEQEELKFGPYQDSISYEKPNIKLTPTQLDQILQKRAELVDDYEIFHSIKPTIKHIEDELDRPLTIDEKKRLVHDDYSMIRQIKLPKSREILPITASLVNLVEQTQDKNVLEKDLDRSLTKQEILLAANGDIEGLEKTLEKPLGDETIESMYKDRFPNLTTPEIEHLKELDKKSSIEKVDQNERLSIDINELDTRKDTVETKAFRFSLSEIEKAIEKSLTNDELKRYAGSRFNQIEIDLGKSLTDLQRTNLLQGDKLTIESLIHRKLTFDETGPHLVNLTEIETILNRSLTYDELLRLANNRFDDICQILQRSLTYDELVDLLNGHDQKINDLIEDRLDEEKEKELKELPIHRIKYFEKIFNRPLSTNELVRFADDRYEPLSRLLSDVMKPEQILDLSSGRYDKIEQFFQRPLTPKEYYELNKSLLQVHLKYSNDLDELEYIIQRRLTIDELRRLTGNNYEQIEKRLGKILTEKQLRNLLQGKDDETLIEINDLVKSFQRKYHKNVKRTRTIVTKLLEQLDRNYHEQQKDTIVEIKKKKSPLQEKEMKVEFEEITSNLLEQLEKDVEKHTARNTPDEHSSDISKDESVTNDDELIENVILKSDQEKTPTSITSLPVPKTDSIKAFETPSRIVEQIAEEEHVEDMATVNNLIDKFLDDLDKPIDEKKSSSSWLANLRQDITSSPLPTIQPINDRLSMQESSHPVETQSKEDIHLGWSLFKSIDRPELGLKEEKPRMVNVKHIAETYVVGIPEEYADERSKLIANKIYRGELIRYVSSKSQLMKEINEFISETFHLPVITDATHFIVPSRGYIDIIPLNKTYQSELIEIEDNEFEMRDSPETLEWYEECIQRNIQVHAQIPIGYQPSIVYCHTGRRTIITPADRAEQRKISKIYSENKSKTIIDQSENISTFHVGLVERISQPMFTKQTVESPSTTRTVTDLIMHTVTSSKKTDLLEALDDLFSEENLDKYQMTETHWQDIFLILLNSYLRSHSINRKEIFQRLTDKLHVLRNKEHLRASGFYPNISVASSILNQTPDSINDENIKENQSKQFHFGLRSPSNSMKSGQTLNDSEYSMTPTTADRQSIVSHDSLVLPSIKHLSNQSLSHNQSSITTPKLIDQELIRGKNLYSQSNTPQSSSVPIRSRRYQITVLHSDDLSEGNSNEDKTTTKESIKLPSIVSKTTPSRAKQSVSTDSTNRYFLSFIQRRNRFKIKDY